MAKLAVYEGTTPNSFGQIKLTILGQTFEIPFKVRITSPYLPDVTIDPAALKRRRKKTKGFDLMSLLGIKAVVLIGNRAVEIDSSGNVKSADPRIFDQPTVLDQLSEAGIIPTLAFIGGAMFFVYRMLSVARR